MEHALVKLSGLFLRQQARDDDFVDRLHHHASLILMLIFAGGSSLLEYGGEPISCWSPTDYTQKFQNDHINGYCWTHPLRYPDSSYEIGLSGVEAEHRLEQRRLVNFGTAFYRWATLIFVLQAMLFKLPRLVWSRLNRQAGTSLTKLKELLTDAQLSQDERDVKMDEAAQYFHSWLAAYRGPTVKKIFDKEVGKLACLCPSCGRRQGKYLSVVYLCVKSLYLLNVVLQFVLLSVFLDAEFWRYGITVLTDVLFHGDWRDPVNFPRLLICDFRLHYGVVPAGATTTAGPVDSKVHQLQCILTINMILEKIFVLQWFWLVMLAVLTIATLITWFIHTVCGCAPYFFARKYMRSLTYPEHQKNNGDRSGKTFVNSYLREDGMFVLRMVQADVGVIVVKELVQHLWDNFQEKDPTFNLEMTKEETDFNQVESSPDRSQTVLEMV